MGLGGRGACGMVSLVGCRGVDGPPTLVKRTDDGRGGFSLSREAMCMFYNCLIVIFLLRELKADVARSSRQSTRSKSIGSKPEGGFKLKPDV